MKFMFFAWGGLGLLVDIGAFLLLLASSSVGVGTSAYIAACALIWIGGMVFFGLGSLIDIALDIKNQGKQQEPSMRELRKEIEVPDVTEERQATMSWAEREQRR